MKKLLLLLAIITACSACSKRTTTVYVPSPDTSGIDTIQVPNRHLIRQE